MGSFTEVVMAFAFESEAPDWVVGSFAEWRVGEAGPPLAFAGESLPLDRRMSLEEIDAYGSSWGDGRGTSHLTEPELSAVLQAMFSDMPTAYFPGTGNTKLVWDDYQSRWALTTRHYRKCGATEYAEVIAFLGRYACPYASEEHPEFVGYLKYEYDDRPLLIWHRGGSTFEFEDTRTPN